MTKENIEVIQIQIETLLGTPIDHTSGYCVKEIIAGISVLLSTGASCIAESKRLELTQRGKWLRQWADKIDKMKPSVAKEFVNTACVDEQILSLRCDRNYSAMVHAGEFYRSILSLIKQELINQI